MKPQIYLVEDEPAIATLLADRLEAFGYGVCGAARSGETALEAVSAYHPDLVLMDIGLAGDLDGIETAQSIRQRWDIPVVFLTSHGDEDTVRRARTAGAFGYLTKPFEENELHATIETVLHRHSTEQRIRSMERWLTDTLSSIGDAVVATDVEGRVTFLNPAAEALTGWRRVEATGRRIDEIQPLVHEETGAAVASPSAAALASGLVTSLEEHVAIRNRHQALIPIDGTASPIRDEHGRTSGVVVVLRDRTEAKAAEAERLGLERKLKEAQKLESLGAMAGGIAHGFNNLLTGVLGSISAVRASLSPDSPHEPELRLAEDCARRAAALCEQMLAYSGKGHFQARPLDLSTLVRETAQVLGASIDSRITLEVDLAANLPAMLGDSGQIHQLLSNLVLNAAEAIGPQGGRIRVATGTAYATEEDLAATHLAPSMPAGLYAYLDVHDDGCGIAADSLARIFDPFYTTKFTGRGLGLSAVLGIVRGHRAAIQVQSQLGRGTRFRIYFPYAAEAAQSARPKLASSAWKGHGTILVVDDEEMVRLPAQRILKRLGFDVIAVGSGSEAIDRVADPANHIRMALLDWRMPEMDGAETLAVLRQIDPQLPVLVMSGYTESQTLSSFHDGPTPAFMAKPFGVDLLTEKVRQVLGE
ncbi:MAG: response regulator [Deltaproteobacteria bacterium]|nr:response regulator [Deltaproteobacteria bacterium]